jgi:NTE family protein
MTDTSLKFINLALQGGGSHGAFTWGVLHALLEDERLQFEGVSGTSAGAMNAVVMASGLVKGGRDGAIKALDGFWNAVATHSPLNNVQQASFDMLFGGASLPGSPLNYWADVFSRTFSPYQFNPLDINPIRDLLRRHVDFPALTARNAPKVFVAATHVASGKAEIFSGKHLTESAVAASCCLPMLFQAVEVEGEHYWDGGYCSNPALHPLIYQCASRDVLLVQINPLKREALPRNSRDILDRVNEITFGASLLAEMRAIDFVSRMLKEGRLDPARYKEVLMHRVSGDVLEPFGASSKMSTDAPFIKQLHDLGHAAGKAWLTRHLDDLGVRCTVNIARDYLDALRMPPTPVQRHAVTAVALPAGPTPGATGAAPATSPSSAPTLAAEPANGAPRPPAANEHWARRMLRKIKGQ